eukprot:TRINITY_DN11549_c0_g1_i1.p1 TRINITY_DN11549_c0_g1~~TRINITY_DN11549_c0_g1_i1.p1  ORF type:complete len:265 (+),score=52.79 TRINITY_DN11549_c0_g1_i1:41-835(+)
MMETAVLSVAGVGEEVIIRNLSMLMLIGMFGAWCALVVFEVKVPYGRYESVVWVGMKIPAKVAWVIQESPCLFTAIYNYSTREQDEMVNKVLLSMFVFHYVNRTLVFPFRIRGGKPWDTLVFLLAASFCSLNGHLITRYLMHHAVYPSSWVTSPQFILGTVLFSLGWCINYHSDDVLRNLRKPGETGYKIPTGGFFNYVSCANYFGEILEWTGFAVATAIPPAACFAISTMCNLIPRAASYHKWYLQKFEDYPKDRKIVIPFVY